MRLSGILLPILFLFGCNPDSKKEMPSSTTLEGRWRMEAAARDGKLTETLKDSYFIFQNPDILINNINRKEMSFKYNVLEGNRIEQRGALDLDYNIIKFQNDTLVLRSQIRDYDFQFLLIRDTLDVELRLNSE